MSHPSVESIKILRQIPLFGRDDTLKHRLQKVNLRGFPDVKIYEKASFELRLLTSGEIGEHLYTPQPHIHQTYLDRINKLATLFQNEGINIFHLDRAYDYVAFSETGEATEWTMLPPIVEQFTVPQHEQGGFDYSGLLGMQLKQSIKEHGWGINPAATRAPYRNKDTAFALINDGSHRVHAGLEAGAGITCMQITGMTPGYPYYAVPQHYSLVKVFPDDKETEDLKIHVINTPGQKQLYRQFPSGGILSGTVRPAHAGENFI